MANGKAKCRPRIPSPAPPGNESMCVGVNDDSSDGATVKACVSGVIGERRHAAGEGQRWFGS
jgi:hypothetical protein